MTDRKTPTRVCRRVASATVLTTSLLASSLLPLLFTSPAAAATPATQAAAGTALAARTHSAATTAPLSVILTAVTPTVATPRAPITITGLVRNTGRVAIASPVAQALLGQRPLTTRPAVSDWAAGTGQQPLTEVARAPLGKTLAPGSATTFVLTVPATAISSRDAFAVLPLRVAVVGSTTGATIALGGLRTFLPTLSSMKRYVPLAVAWLVPLTLDPDPALHGTDSPARTAAWKKAVGPGSRLDRLIQGTEGANVTWAIDPAILGPRPIPAAAVSATPTPTSSPSTGPEPGTSSAPDPVTAATTALANRLKADSPRHTLWSLPYADPDLSALMRFPSASRAMATLVSRPSTLDAAVGPARTDIAWPVGGNLTTPNEAQLRQAYTHPGLAAAVTSASTLADRNGTAGDASRRSSTGLPLLAYDEALSRTVAQTSSGTTGAVTIQRFLADSMALLGERPGTRNRSVLIAEPRTFAGDPAVLKSLFAAVAQAKWLTPTTTGQLLATSAKVAPETPGPVTKTTGPTAASGRASLTASDPLTPKASPLTAHQVSVIPGRVTAITGSASILEDGRLFMSRWSDAQVQQLSARWRGHPEGVIAINSSTTAAISAISRSVRVAPSSVNFFADRGIMQVTVVNDLTVPIHDVHLTLVPAQPRLRIEQQPGPLKIGAKSRTNVQFPVTSIAAGLVRIDAALSTRNGTPLGKNASVNVRVQPPSTWIYWVLGGLAGMVLVLGTYRSLRRGSTRGSRPGAQEHPLDDRVLHD
ncbi:MAG TPA: DUF6049 family protein [Dermatophilaceae bacterium]